MARPKHIAVAWYHSAADYTLLKHISADGHELPESFQEWTEETEKSVSLFTTQGWTIEKVYLDPMEFPAWCRALGVRIDLHARVAFASAVVARKYPEIR